MGTNYADKFTPIARLTIIRWGLTVAVLCTQVGSGNFIIIIYIYIYIYIMYELYNHMWFDDMPLTIYFYLVNDKI